MCKCILHYYAYSFIVFIKKKNVFNAADSCSKRNCMMSHLCMLLQYQKQGYANSNFPGQSKYEWNIEHSFSSFQVMNIHFSNIKLCPHPSIHNVGKFLSLHSTLRSVVYLKHKGSIRNIQFVCILITYWSGMNGSGIQLEKPGSMLH